MKQESHGFSRVECQHVLDIIYDVLDVLDAVGEKGEVMKLGQFLDTVDRGRESDETLQFMDENGVPHATLLMRSPLLNLIEDREVTSIMARGADTFGVWLAKEE